MKQIFDWLREQFDKQSINGISENGLVVTSFIHSKIAKLCIDEAEAKWESDCCEWTELIEYKQRVYANCRFTNDSLDAMSIGYFKFCPYCGKRIKISEVE